MPRSPALKPVGTRAPPLLRLLLFGMLVVTAIATSLWRTADFRSLQASNHPHDAFDSIVDVFANAIGAGAALSWLAASHRRVLAV